jgi:ATP-dependent phosphoenolpyruvate carboxykinase
MNVPVGSFSFTVSSASGFSKGDKIIVFRPGTEQWIKDLKMDQIEERDGTKQWQPKEYDLQFERVITKIEGKKYLLITRWCWQWKSNMAVVKFTNTVSMDVSLMLVLKISI